MTVMRPKTPTVSASKHQQGFSMLEVLITLVIVATALFGTAGLQAYAMRMNQGAQFRAQAVFLASDIAERMESNKAAAVAGNYVVALTSTPSAAATDCTANGCDPAALSAWDVSQWELAIAGNANNPALLPQPSWSITQTTPGNPSTYRIEISWTDRRSDKTSGGENFTLTLDRTIGI
jgi:type IV pilus assembly protein PilV